MRKTTLTTSNPSYGSDGTPGEQLKSAFCHSEDVGCDRDLAQVTIVFAPTEPYPPRPTASSKD
jgi:hypothetical protein